jgi:hypothetical protein
VQLKSGDSYVKKRKRDGAEVFQIKNPRWADYWQQQACHMMLVIRTVDGEIRRTDVTAYLKCESTGRKTMRQIVFAGERFDAVNHETHESHETGRPPPSRRHRKLCSGRQVRQLHSLSIISSISWFQIVRSAARGGNQGSRGAGLA